MNNTRHRRPYRIVKKKYENQHQCPLKYINNDPTKMCIIFLAFIITIAMLKGFILCKVTSK